MRKIDLITGLCLVFLMMFGTFAHAQKITINKKGEIIQQTPDGEINWSTGVISAVGYASHDQPPYAQRVAAAANARANLLMVLGEMNIKRGITVKKGKVAGDINIQTVEGILSGSFVGKPTRQSDGTLAVAAYKTISPELLSELLPTKYFTPEPGESEYKPEAPSAPVSFPLKPHTGLIIDARELGVIPSLGFRVLVDGTQEVLYGFSSVSRMKVIEKKGMAAYTRSVEDAKKRPRVGDNPLIVKATGGCSERNTDLYISKEDAAKVYSANLKNSFLQELKVVVVCGG